ncbi:MAG: addiction module protein [Chloroflexi bacterium]|nr:addiction module protein [Chloroflexota bacterium]
MNELATQRLPDTVSATIDELLKLSSSDRVDIAMALWESLSDEERDAQFDLTDEVKAELDRRWERYLANPQSAMSREEVLERLKHRRPWCRSSTVSSS